MSKSSRTRQKILSDRNENIRAMFTQLFEVERLRYDDVVKHIKQQFYLGEPMIIRIIAKKAQAISDISDIPQAANPNNLSTTLFDNADGNESST